MLCFDQLGSWRINTGNSEHTVHGSEGSPNFSLVYIYNEESVRMVVSDLNREMLEFINPDCCITVDR